MTQLLLLSITISFLSLGFRAITGPGMILYFMREWLDKIAQKKKNIANDISLANQQVNNISKSMQEEYSVNPNGSEEIKRLNNDLRIYTTLLKNLNNNPILKKKYDYLLYWMKPVILCSTCMASLHTLIWFPVFHGLKDFWLIVPAMLIVATFNTIIWRLIEKLGK